MTLGEQRSSSSCRRFYTAPVIVEYQELPLAWMSRPRCSGPTGPTDSTVEAKAGSRQPSGPGTRAFDDFCST